MQPTTTLIQKLRQLLLILGPILVTQVALSAMTFLDTTMSGRFGHVDLAGVAIGSNIWLPVYTGLSGILIALTPIIAQLLGAQRNDRITQSVVQGVYLAVLLALAVSMVGLFIVNPLLGNMQLEPDVHQIAHRYLLGLGLGIVPLFIYTVLRSFIDALGKTRVSMLITLASLPINALLNFVLIYGKWGFPRLGGVGAGYASAITYWLIAIVAGLVVAKVQPFRAYGVFRSLSPVSLAAWREQLKIGLPLGFSIFFEVSIFSAVTLLMSGFGTVVIAAHQAAMNFATLVYMIPMSISLTLTIAIGFEAGARRTRHAMQYALLGIATSLLMALTAAVMLVLFKEHIAAFYTSDQHVLQLVQSFLAYVIFFQLSDAIAAPIQGALRGFKDVNVILALALVAYWVIGLPLGYVLANYSALGPYGYWLGLISGLAAGAIGLAWRLWRVQHQASQRLAPRPVTAS